MNSSLIIHKGEQFVVPVEVEVNGQNVSPDDVDGIRIQIGDRLCEWPDGELDYDMEEETWLYPLTEAQTMSMYAGQRKAQIAVMIGDAILETDVFGIDVKESIIKKRWTKNE